MIILSMHPLLTITQILKHTTAPDDIQEWHAWKSATQSNPYASDAKFTGITSFQNHIIAFKDGFIHELYNTKNPFRIQDLFREGCIDNRSICEVDGSLYFVDRDGVKALYRWQS